MGATVIDRRQLGKALSGAIAGALFMPPRFAIASGAAKVVVIGGGPAGATVASQVKKSAPALDVTLIEPLVQYTSCFFSNYYIGGMRSFSSITHRYAGFDAIGVNFIHQTATAIDLEKKLVHVKRGPAIPYDRLVVAPGIDFKFDGIERYSEATAEVMPHAWKGGHQAQILRGQLKKMRDGGVVVIAPPKMPYRCPPGPYERVCAIANYLKQEKSKSKVILLDPKMNFSKQPVFEEAFKAHYEGIVEVHLTNDIDDYSVSRIDTRTGEIETKAGLTVKADVANIIPQQTAGRVALEAGLGEGDWCPVKPENFASEKAKDVYVLGDAAIAADMPKSAYAANSQALVVAADIVADLANGDRPIAHYQNTCWSFLSPGNSAKIGAEYAPGEFKGAHGLAPSNAFVSQPGESPDVRKQAYDESQAWYRAMTDEMFQKKSRG